MSEKTKIVIVGYGNIGRGVYQAIEKNKELYDDMTLVGIITRRPQEVKREVNNVKVFDDSINTLSYINADYISADVAILCGGSKEDLPKQGPLYAQVLNTVDSFDTHVNIPKYFRKMDKIAKGNGNVAIISTGWDPGTFSLERVLADAFIPSSNKYTFWGKGVSQGHSDAVRKIDGVLDARQYTIPIEDAMNKVRNGENPDLTIREKHTRLVYVVVKEDADKEKIEKEIKEMPNYFFDYDTEVKFIGKEEMIKNHSAYPHAGFVMTTGETGKGNKALIEYRVKWDSNPEATANILVAHARAAQRISNEGRTGAFTILDIPAAYLSPHSGEYLRSHFM